MSDAKQQGDHARIHAEWHRAASQRDGAALIALYADDAVLESPLVPALLADKTDGVLRGKAEILTGGPEHARAQALLRARYPQLGGMEIAQLPVIAVRLERVTSWGNLDVE